MIFYVTTLPSPDPFGLEDDPPVAKLAVVDLSTGQWRDLDLSTELKTRFGLDRPRVFFEIARGPNEVVVSRD
jgi:hypothetical protein